MKHRRNTLWLASTLVLALLPAARPAAGQTESIPLSTIPQAPPPQSGTLDNGVAFEVDRGQWFSDPSFLDAWFFSVNGDNPGPSTWTFDQPVALRFGITNLQVTSDGGEGVQLPEGTEAEFIHPNHVWDPDTLIIRNGPGTTQPDESTFTHPGIEVMVFTGDGAPQAQRGVSFIEVTPLQADLAMEKVAEVQVTKQVLFTLTVTNNGAADATGVTVDDDLPECTEYLSDDCDGDEGPPWAWDIGDLANGDSATCTITVDASACAGLGTQTNTATVEGDQEDPDASNDTGDADFDVEGTPGITIEKSASGPDPLEVGATIDYEFLVTNTGNVTLTDVEIADPLDGLSPVDCPESTLAPGAEMTCTATYTVTQEDVDTGVIENTAAVTGTPPGDLSPPTDEGTTTFPPDQSPGISMEKTGSGPDPLTVGATVEYEFLVTNIGNVTLNNVTITDPLPGLSPIECPGTTLAPGAEMTCTATYEVTQADTEAGVIENTATVSGETPTGGPPPTDESTTTVPPAEPVPALPPLSYVLLVALLAAGTLWTLRRARV